MWPDTSQLFFKYYIHNTNIAEQPNKFCPDPCLELDCFLYKVGHAVDAVRAATEWMGVLDLLKVCPVNILPVLNVDTLEVC